MFFGSVAENGGGVCTNNSGSVDLTNSIFHLCKAGVAGGGLWSGIGSGSSTLELELRHLNFTGCTASNGSALFSKGWNVVFSQTNFNQPVDQPSPSGVIVQINAADGISRKVKLPSVAFNYTVPNPNLYFIVGQIEYNDSVGAPGLLYWNMEGEINEYCLPPLPLGNARVYHFILSTYSYTDSWGYDQNPIWGEASAPINPPVTVATTHSPEAEVPVVVPSENPTTPTATVAASSSGRTLMIILIVLGCVFVIAAIVLIVFLLRGGLCARGIDEGGKVVTLF
jgi:hypothetical protein